MQTGIGPVTVTVPKVRSKTGKPITFHSALVPPYVRKAKSLEAALPWLYLNGVEGAAGVAVGVSQQGGQARDMVLGDFDDGGGPIHPIVAGAAFLDNAGHDGAGEFVDREGHRGLGTALGPDLPSSRCLRGR